MGRFAFVLIYFFMATIFTNMAVQRTGLWYWTPLTESRLLKLFALYTDERKYDVLILGSSVAKMGILPSAMEEELSLQLPGRPALYIYNTSVNGALLPAYLLVMRRIVGEKQNPRVVLLFLGVRAFNGNEKEHINREVRLYTSHVSEIITILKHAPQKSTKWKALGSFTRGLESILQLPQFSSKKNRRSIHITQNRRGSIYRYRLIKKNRGGKRKPILPGTKQIWKRCG